MEEGSDVAGLFELVHPASAAAERIASVIIIVFFIVILSFLFHVILQIL